MKVYICISIGVVIIRYMATDKILVVFLGLSMLPQIVQIAVKQVNSRIDFYFNIIFLNARLLVLVSFGNDSQLYHRGCPLNVEEFEPYIPQCAVLVSLVLLQILVLRHQSMNGARSILPECLLPPKYQYFVKLNPEKLQRIEKIPNRTPEYEDEICPICLEGIYTPSNESLQEVLKNNPFYHGLANKKEEYMKAPCGHVFHIICLLNWMSIKMECPSCRNELPPL